MFWGFPELLITQLMNKLTEEKSLMHTLEQAVSVDSHLHLNLSIYTQQCELSRIFGHSQVILHMIPAKVCALELGAYFVTPERCGQVMCAVCSGVPLRGNIGNQYLGPSHLV